MYYCNDNLFSFRRGLFLSFPSALKRQNRRQENNSRGNRVEKREKLPNTEALTLFSEWSKAAFHEPVETQFKECVDYKATAEAGSLNENGRNVKITILITLLLMILIFSGCTSIPFYKKNTKATQSLQLGREGITAYEHKELETAEDKLREAIEMNENDIDARRYYAETLWERGKRKEALDILEAAVKKKETHDQQVILNQSLGEKLLLLQRPKDAVVCAERIILLQPQKHEGWVIRANAQWQMGNKEKALADYQRALTCSPDDRDILWQLAHLEDTMEKPERALAAWQHLSRVYPLGTVPPDVYYGIAGSCYRLKRLRDASDNLASAIKLQPARKEFHQLLAQVYFESGNIQQAFIAASQAVECAPDDPFSRDLYKKIEQVRIAGLPMEKQFR